MDLFNLLLLFCCWNSGGSGARWDKQKSDLEVSFYRPWLMTRMMSSCLLWLQRRKNTEKFQDWSTRLAVSSNEASWCARESMTIAKKWFLAEETLMVFFFQNPRQEQRRRKHEVHIFTGPCFPIILCTLFWALQVGPKQVLNLICGSILGFFRHRYKLTHYHSTFFCTYCVTFQVQSQVVKCWPLLFIQVLICFFIWTLWGFDIVNSCINMYRDTTMKTSYD